MRRHLNWTLKSLKVGYGRDDEQLPLTGFTPALSFPQSRLELLLEGEWTAGCQTQCRESWMKEKAMNNTFFFLTGRWIAPLTKSAKNPLCERAEDGPAGEGDASQSR